jgi:hypothetical protein
MLNIFSVVSVRTVCKVRGSRTSNSWHCACGRAGGPAEKARLPESGGRRFGWSLEVTACDRRAPVVHTTHRGTVYVRCVPLALLLVLAVHPCACAHGTKVHVNFERRSHTSTKPRNKVQLAARPLQRRALRARTAPHSALSMTYVRYHLQFSVTRPELGHLVHRPPLCTPLSSHSTVSSIRAHRSSMELRADDEGARGSCKCKKRRWKGCAAWVTAPAQGGDGKNGAWALPRRCARLCIALHCVSMLACRRDSS